MKKRTKAIDDAREVALPTIGPGVFTTVGELTLTGEEHEEKAAKQLAGLRLANVQEVVNGIRSLVNARLEVLIQQIAPASVVADGEAGVAKWMSDTGFHIFRRDLTWHVHVNGRAVMELPVFVAPAFRADVLAYMAADERRAASSNGH